MGQSVFPAPSSAAALPSLQQTFNSTSNTVSVPSGITFVYALVIGGGGGFIDSGSYRQSPGGAIVFGATPVSAVATIGAGGSAGTLYNSGNDSPSSPGGQGGDSGYGLIRARGGKSQSTIPTGYGGTGTEVIFGNNWYPQIFPENYLTRILIGGSGGTVQGGTSIPITGFTGGTGAGYYHAGSYQSGGATATGTSGSVTLFY
jgi:hypothetical protein